jgi:ABC-type Co2+ transport system permease subunit
MLWAVHISESVLTPAWMAGGFAVAGILVLLAAWRLREDDVPRIALLTAAVFISSVIHVDVGPTSVHLLLNGLVGVVLGWRSALAIAVGLLLQVILLQHGGFSTLGVNACVLTAPALLSWGLFHGLNRFPWVKQSLGRSLLVGACAALWFLSGVYSLALALSASLTELDATDLQHANAAILHPLSWLGGLLFAAGMIWVERRLENAPEFPLGLLVGEVAVLLTVALDTAVLVLGGNEVWHTLVFILVLPHLPIAVIEGVVLGFAVGFLAKVKPEMLGLPRAMHCETRAPEASG